MTGPALKGLLVLLDGVGDRPSPALAGRTPLAAADTPRLDELARRGRTGRCDPLGPGVPVDTHTGMALMLGLPPEQLGHLRRGPVEAAGVGLEMRAGDVAIRCNFATVRRTAAGLEILDRRAGRIREEVAELAATLSGLPMHDGITTTLRPATQHRAVLRLSGDGLSPDISDTDPGADARVQRLLPAEALTSDPRARRTAEALNVFLGLAADRLADHPVNARRLERGQPPANGLLTRGAGVGGHFQSLVGRLGLRAALIAGERTVVGLGRLFGFTVNANPGFTGLADTDLRGKVAAALDALEDHHVVFLHVKAPDICAHDRDPEAKRAILETIDAALAPLLDVEAVVGVSSDHCTDSGTGAHCGDPVPCLLSWPHVRPDDTSGFDETACLAGGLGRLSALAYVSEFLAAMGALPEGNRGDHPRMP